MNEDQNKQTTEVQETEEQQGNTNIQRETVTTTTKADNRVIARNVIYYVTGIIIVFLVFRIVLLLLAANQGNGFVDFIYGVSGFFAGPFFGIFSYQPTYGQSTFELSSLVAIVVYALAGAGLVKLLSITQESDEA